MLCNGQVEFTKGQIVVIRELAEGLDTIDALKDKFGGKEGGCAFVEVVPDMPCVPRLVRRRSRCLRHVPRHRHLRCPSARQRRHQPPYAALSREYPSTGARAWMRRACSCVSPAGSRASALLSRASSLLCLW